MKNFLLSYAALWLLSGCASVTTIFNDSVKLPEQTMLVGSLQQSFDYQRFSERREEAREKLKETDNLALAEAADPTFPLSAGGVAIIPDPELEERLKLELSELLKFWPYAPPPLNIAVTDDEKFGAETTPGGTIIVNSGVLVGTQFIDEVAFILAHEAAHALLDHFKALEDQRKFEQAASLTAGLIATIDDQRGASGKMTEEAAKALFGLFASNGFLFGPAFERKQEAAADFLAVDLLVKRSYSLNGATSVLERLIDDGEKQRALVKEICGEQNEFLSSLFEQENAEEQNPICQRDTNILTHIFSLDDHPAPEKRKTAIDEYIQTYYSDIDLRRLQADEQGNNMLNILSPSGAVARSVQAANALRALSAGDLAKAEELALGSILDEEDTTPKPRYAMYKVRKAQYLKSKDERCLDDAIANLAIATGGDYATRDIYLALAEEYAGKKLYEKAISTLTDAGNRFGDAETYYPQQIQYHLLAEQPEQAEAIVDQCTDTHDKRLITQCVAKVAQLQTLGDVVKNNT